jgi:hypothetical protein
MSDTLAVIAGLLISSALSFFPKLRPWYATLDGPQKLVAALASYVLASVAIFGAGCLGLWQGSAVECTQGGLLDLLKLAALAFASGQLAYSATPTAAKAHNKNDWGINPTLDPERDGENPELLQP